MNWTAHTAENWAKDAVELVIIGDAGGARWAVTGELVVVPLEELHALPDRARLTMPEAAWEAVVALVAPTADRGAVAVLEAALELERRRVDWFLGRALERVGPARG